MSREGVIVGLSGGVDSFAAAYLLKEAGYQVTAVHLILHDPSYEATKRHLEILAKSLGVPLVTRDLRDRFKKTIIEPFVKRYLAGKTPNPCAWCNERIKFHVMTEIMEELGIPLMATGHYAKKEFDPIHQRWFIARGKDRSKDQSYFLAFATQEQLERLLLPLGEETKKNIKEGMKDLCAPVSLRSESHDICFLEGTSLSAFISAWIGQKTKKGTFVDSRGNVLGAHEGFYRFTIGQRRGIGIADKTPYYVTALFPEKNQVQVGKVEDLYKTTFRASECRWHLSPETETFPVACQIRYRHAAAAAIVQVLEARLAKVTFSEPQRAITPGQIAAFYQDNRLVGAGVIETVEP